MNLEYFIARKIYSAKEGGKGMPPAVRIAVTGIALGLAVMVLSVAIITGFKKEVRNKVIGFGSHIQVTNLDNNISYETQPITTSDSLLESIRSFPGIRHAEVFATKPGLLKTATDNQGIVLKGIGEDYDWTFFRNNLKEGKIFPITPGETSTQVLISRYLSNLLGLATGDSFLAYFVQENVRARKFTISGIYETGFEDYDKFYVIADIKQVRRLNGWSGNESSGLELQVDNYERVDEITEALYYALAASPEGNNLYVRSVKELNPMIFSWLSVLDMNVAIILILMIAVAGFTMISGLLVIILERIRMIGILKALGETNANIRRIFLYLAFLLISKGMLWGNLVGAALCFLQWRFRFFKLDASTYYIDAVPISLTWQSFLFLNAGAMAASMLMMLAPSHVATTIDPAKTIQFE